MPDFQCAVADIQKISCDGQAGIAALFVTTASQIDFDLTTISGRTVSAWTMQASGVWAEIYAERRNARVDFNFTSANGFYEVSAQNLLIRGQEEARTTALENMKSCCDIIVQAHFENGVIRVFGRDYKDGGWLEPVDGVEITSLLETSGVFGAEDDKVRSEFSLGGAQSTPPVYSSVDITTMRGLKAA